MLIAIFRGLVDIASRGELFFLGGLDDGGEKWEFVDGTPIHSNRRTDSNKWYRFGWTNGHPLRDDNNNCLVYTASNGVTASASCNVPEKALCERAEAICASY